MKVLHVLVTMQLRMNLLMLVAVDTVQSSKIICSMVHWPIIVIDVI